MSQHPENGFMASKLRAKLQLGVVLKSFAPRKALETSMAVVTSQPNATCSMFLKSKIDMWRLRKAEQLSVTGIAR